VSSTTHIHPEGTVRSLYVLFLVKKQGPKIWDLVNCGSDEPSGCYARRNNFTSEEKRGSLLRGATGAAFVDFTFRIIATL
jgi:hypothetical protein